MIVDKSVTEKIDLVSSVLVDSSLEGVGQQNPIPTKFDSIYASDIDLNNSDFTGWTGDPLNLFMSPFSEGIENLSGENPKYFKIAFNRTVYATEIGFGCNDIAKNFGADITIKFLGSGDVVRKTVSSIGGNINSRLIGIGKEAFNAILIEFPTAGPVYITNLTARKTGEVEATIKGATPSQEIKPVNVTDDGDLSISDNSSGLSIAEGKVSGKTFIHKFGKTPNFDIADGYVSIWDGANNNDIGEAQYTYSTTAIIDSLSSTSVTDNQNIEVQGLDANYDMVTQTIQLNGQNRVALTTSLIRVFRLKNVGVTDLAGFVYCYEDTILVGGRPSNTKKVRAVIEGGNNQTLMAIYTIPAGKTGYMRDLFASLAGARRTSVHNIRLFVKPFGQVFQLKYDASLIANGTSSFPKNYIEPEIIPEKADIEIRVNTDEEDAGVSGGFDIVLVDN